MSDFGEHPLGWAVSLGWALYLIALGVWIVLQKRSPLSTLAWILTLAALPVLGFLIYFYLGPQKIKRQRLRRARLRHLHRCQAQGDPALAATLPRRKQGLSRLVEAATGAPVSNAAKVELLVGGTQTFDAIVAAIAAARRHVHLEYYIFEPDAVGVRLRDILAARARDGVKVRLLLDAVGSARVSWRFLAPLRRAGAEIVFFHPFRLATLRPLLNLRTHRKIAVIDGTVGFVGGVNISAEQDARLRSTAWHDLHLRLEGLAVGWLQAVFAEDWHYARRRPLAESELYPDAPAGRNPVQIIASGPDSDSEAIHRAFLQAIADARSRVWLATPYFVPGEAALYALSNAALRGIDVRLLLPARSDSRLVGLAARSYYDELQLYGVRIYEYQPAAMHAKAMLVDDDCALIGTANFDLRSFRLNFEVAVAVYDREFAATLAHQFELDFGQSRRVSRSRPLGLPARMAEAFARLLSPLL